MVKSLPILFSFLIIGYIQAQAVKNVKVSGFNKVVFEGGFEVLIKPSSEEKLILSGSQKELDNIDVEVRSGTLYVEFKKNYRFRNRVQAKLDYKQLQGIVLAGSGKIENKGTTLKSKSLVLKIMGAGDISLSVQADVLESTISGSGDIELTGKVAKHEVRISGSGDVDCKKLETDDANIRISGSGEVWTLVKNSLDAKVSGSGDINYKGNPKTLKTKVSGSGEIRKMEKP